MTKTKDNKRSGKDVSELETHGRDENIENNTGFLFYFMAFVTALVIMTVVPFGVFYYAIKNNVKNIANTYEEEIKNIPLLNMALPEKPDPDDPDKYTFDELKEKYIEIKDERNQLKDKLEDEEKLNEKIKSLEEKLKKEEDGKKAAQENAKKIEEEYIQKEEEIKKQKDELDRIAAEGDKEGFKKYFEDTDEELAENIYKSLKKEDVKDEEAKKFAQTYEKMEAEAAAKIFEELGINKIELVCDIFKSMKKDNTSEILSEMDPLFASQITEKLSRDYLYELP